MEIVYVHLQSCSLECNAKLPGKGVLANCSGSFLEFQRSLGECRRHDPRCLMVLSLFDLVPGLCSALREFHDLLIFPT